MKPGFAGGLRQPGRQAVPNPPAHSSKTSRASHVAARHLRPSQVPVTVETRHEREAEQMADAALRAPGGPPQSLPEPVADSEGQRLSDGVRAEMEERFQHDFSEVRVHSAGRAAASAAVLGARAYSHGPLIVFGPGEYRPGTENGRRLLAHELAHVIQSGSDQAVGLQLYPKPPDHEDRLSRAQYLAGVSWLEEHGSITSEEAQTLRIHIPESRHQRAKLLDSLERRAVVGRAGISVDEHGRQRGKHLITNFHVTPKIIHVDHGEAARIEFDLPGASTRDVDAEIVKYETTSELPDARFFHLAQGPGHKVAVWDGTFTGARREAPETATYRVRVSATDADGNRETAFEQIRVVNTTGATVLPRTESGVELSPMRFDGHQVVLADALGNKIVARATSGLRPNNKHNPEHRDYTKPRYEALEGKGPIPPGRYFIASNDVQMPDLKGGRVQYPSGGGARGWGPFRVQLKPADPSRVHGRSGFFFHLDVTDDGTAGCIGIAPSDEAKFNQMMALIMHMGAGKTLPVEVAY